MTYGLNGKDVGLVAELDAPDVSVFRNCKVLDVARAIDEVKLSCVECQSHVENSIVKNERF